MNNKILAFFVLFFLATSNLFAKDLFLKIATRKGEVMIVKFSGYDDKKLNFELKSGKQEREISLRDISVIYFDTTFTEVSPQGLSDSLDVFSMTDGSMTKGVFRKMSSDEIKALILEKELKNKKLPIPMVKKISFSLNILDVNRREYGTGFNLFGKDVEVELANGFASEIEQEKEPLDDTLVNNYVDRLGKRIAVLSKRPDLGYSFKVLNSNEINAFTIGGGKVYLYRGLIEHVDNESELAGVIAHEIGHNVGKHTVKQLSKQLLYYGVISGAGELIKTKNEEWGEVFKEAGGVVSYFALMKFSRDDEREADFLGVYNLYELGYDPSGMITLFEKFKKLEGSEPSKFETWFRSHPSPTERVENTGAEIQKLTVEYLKKDDPQFQIIKQHLQELPQPIIKQPLVNDTLLVQANSLSWFEIKIDTSMMKNYELKGEFVATGGSGNDIKVFLFDQVNFLNWKNGHDAPSIYSSGQVTAGKINLPFKQSGTYYLVFDNRFSALTGKSVIVAAWAEFTQK